MLTDTDFPMTFTDLEYWQDWKPDAAHIGALPD
jgi:hypothetical protein